MKSQIQVEVDSIANLIIEGWRLKKESTFDPKIRMSINRFIKVLETFIDENNMLLEDLTGQNFDPGFAVEVIHTENADIKMPDHEIIIEMIRPILFYDGTIVRHGQVVTKKVGDGGTINDYSI